MRHVGVRGAMTIRGDKRPPHNIIIRRRGCQRSVYAGISITERAATQLETRITP
ncbi:hypothetical protein KCP73_21715 [Salmonella enterica subsp. enterica]|nr:hypothetical protein KCP73_21715 [Salmonella enterica subsp. enterica]